ncbi:immunoglobulin-like domain-containing protein [Bifidobacterium ramosum]|nr:immunoglobulin-like domain-containing protein [Bifidobacterium ramosum]
MPSVRSTSVSFVDVTKATPHVASIAWLASSGVSTGWSTPRGREFRPRLSVTRQDMAAFLYRVAGSPTFDVSKAKNPFRDVTVQTPHYTEVLWLASTGISTGWTERDGSKTFRGMSTVKRQDMAAFLRRLATYAKADPRLGKAISFRDVTSTTPHAADIAWLAKTGVTTGWKETGGSSTFRGMNSVIRQDMAAFLQRTNDNVINTSKPQPNPNKPTEPNKPTQPDKPTEPSKPTNPDKPTQPDKPSEPDKPTTPADKTAPIFSGVKDGTVEYGAKFDPKSGVTATDDTDGDVTANIIVTGTVNTSKSGTYTLTYTVTDKAGNKAAQTRRITVKAMPAAFTTTVREAGTGWAITKDGSLWTWGDNTLGQVADGTTSPRLTPYRVPALSGVKSVGGLFAVTDDGSLWTWGSNEFGTVGDGTTNRHLTPYRVPGLSGVKFAGYRSAPGGSAVSYAVTGDGSLWTWGSNFWGEVGNGTKDAQLVPYRIPELSDVKSVGGDGYTMFAVTGDGSLWMWGSNGSGQLGDGTTEGRLTPYKVPGLTDVKIGGLSYAITGDGSLWTWGPNSYGQVGDGTTEDRLTPYKVPGLTDVQVGSVSHGDSYAITGDGSLWTWGNNSGGRIGDGTLANRLTPYRVPELSHVKSAGSANGYSYVITHDGNIWTWGNNGYGTVGDGTTNTRLTPYRVPGLTHVTTGGINSTGTAFAVTDDGDLWTWGSNYSGRVGDGTTVDRTTPYRVPGLSDVKSIGHNGYADSYVVTGDGSLWTWGWNGAGYVGDGTTADRLTPYKVQFN